MDTHTLATLLLAELSRREGGRATRAELAAACDADDRATEAAAAWLLALGLVEERDGAIVLRGRGAPTTRDVVLIVENTAAVAHVAAALLDSEGYGVLLASALPPAEAVLRCASIALVIVDSFAATAAAAIERLAPLRRAAGSTPVLLFTAHRDLTLDETRAAGFAGLLPKPFDIDELIDRVRAAIDAARRG